jgi:hypothetical protein
MKHALQGAPGLARQAQPRAERLGTGHHPGIERRQFGTETLRDCDVDCIRVARVEIEAAEARN